MPAYQLQIKQVVDYPRCRIYRQFVHRLMADRSIRTSGGSGLFYFTVLCSYANFRTSYRRIDGISYTIYPGEWVCTLKEVSQWFRTRFQCQALTVLEQLQKQHFITFQTLDRGNVIRYKICDWARHNTVLEYNAPCQKAPPQKDNKKPILRISEEGSVEIRRPFFLRISEEGADSRLAVRAPAI